MDSGTHAEEMNKNDFLLLLNLQAIKPDQQLDDEKRLLIPPLSCMALREKNNSTITGYENFCLIEGNTKLHPITDFDFIGKHVVCQKCYQRFASKYSYKAHIGTDICVKSFNGRNFVYVKYKNKYGGKKRSKYRTKPLDDFHHDIKKNLLNPEMLNTLQTRKNCYSDIVYPRVKVKAKPKEKPVNNNEPPEKKRRGRPRKNVETEPKKLSPPKQLDSKIVDNPNDGSFNNNLKGDKTEFKKPIPVNNSNVVDACNNIRNGSIRLMSSSIKCLKQTFLKMFNKDWRFNIESYIENNLKKDEGKNVTPSMKEIMLILEEIKNELKFMFKEIDGAHTLYNTEDIDLMLLKLEEKQSELNLVEPKKTHVHSDLTTCKGKENIHCSTKKNDDETKVNTDEENFGSDEKCNGRWVNNMSMDGENATSQNIFENKLETLTEDITQNGSNPIQSHLNNVDLNHIHNPILECRTCKIFFASVGEWKMHRDEHASVANTKLLCKICGLKFRVHKNYLKHMKTHIIIKQKNEVKQEKNFQCKMCDKQYNFLASYFNHVKTHLKQES